MAPPGVTPAASSHANSPLSDPNHQEPNRSTASSTPTGTLTPPAPFEQAHRDFRNSVTVRVPADYHVHLRPDFVSLFRSLMAASIIPPGLRLPAQDLGVTQIHRILNWQINQASPADSQDTNVCHINLGDNPDKNDLREWKIYQKVIKDSHHTICASSTSNHEVQWSGVTSTGDGPAGLILQLLLHTLGPDRSIENDIAQPETAGNLQNKADAIKHYHEIIGIPFQPVLLHAAKAQEYTLIQNARLPDSNNEPLQPIDQNAKIHYQTRTWKSPPNNPNQIFRDFWKSHILANQIPFWESTVHILPTTSNENASKNWIHLSAFQMKEFVSDHGNKIPVYYINLDSMDFTNTSLADGGNLQGHVSETQVHLIRAFMDEMLRLNPHAKFILGSHYQMKQIAELESSGLARRILSDESVLAVLEAHVHKRDYYDINTLEGVNRKTPLPAITAPALIDNAELLTLKLTLEGNTLQLAFDYHGIDLTNIPGNGPEVQTAVSKARKSMVTFLTHWDHIRTKTMQYVASNASSIPQKFRAIFHARDGELVKKGVANDQALAYDAISGMVVNSQAVMREAFDVIMLTLGEVKIQDPLKRKIFEKNVAKFRDAFQRKFDHVNKCYEDSLNGKAPNIMDQDDFEQLGDTDFLLEQTTSILQRIIDKGSGLSEDDKKLLSSIKNIILHLVKYFEQDYKTWIYRYANLLRTNRPPEEIAKHADLFGRAHFMLLQQHLMTDIPFGSHAAAYMTIMAHDAVQAYNDYHERMSHTPAQIRYERNLATGEVKMTDIPPDLTSEERDRIKKEMRQRLDLISDGQYSRQLREAEEIHEKLERERKQNILPHFNYRYLPTSNDPLENPANRPHILTAGLEVPLYLNDNDFWPDIYTVMFGGVAIHDGKVSSASGLGFKFDEYGWFSLTIGALGMPRQDQVPFTYAELAVLKDVIGAGVYFSPNSDPDPQVYLTIRPDTAAEMAWAIFNKIID